MPSRICIYCIANKVTRWKLISILFHIFLVCIWDRYKSNNVFFCSFIIGRYITTSIHFKMFFLISWHSCKEQRLSLQCLNCRLVVMNIQIFFPIFSCIIFPLIINVWYIYSICGITKVIRSGIIMNLCIGKITIWFNSFGSRSLMHRLVVAKMF